jgi:hypothetical protein
VIDQKFSIRPPMATHSVVAAASAASKDRFLHHHVHHVHHVHHHLEPYELSEDLIAKQLEVLEKKYGGARKAKESALTIQRAFRR